MNRLEGCASYLVQSLSACRRLAGLAGLRPWIPCPPMDVGTGTTPEREMNQRNAIVGNQRRSARS